MIDASLELQGAIVARLKGSAAVSELIGDRVHDHVPRDTLGNVTARFPYVSFGPEQIVPADTDCIGGSEIYLQIDAWSRDVGFPQVKRLAGAVRKALHDAEIELAENGLVSIAFDGSRIFRDPDGVTSHAAMTFVAIIEHD